MNFDDINWRKLINNVSDKEQFKKLVTERSWFYIGIDPTADALHIGHYLAFVVAKHLTKLGMHVVFVIGGFTALIGDPSGKNQERPMVDNESIHKNVKAISKAIKNIASALDITNYEIVNNFEYYDKMSIVNLFQKYGKLFNVNTMLSRESVKKRLVNGISFTEFSYQVFQAIDFLKLYQTKHVKIQVGGSDQWGNMMSGLELVRKVEGENKELAVLTFNLITNREGEKIGKTQGKPIWLDKKRFSSFDLYQYFFNLDDDVAKRFLAQLTFITENDFKKIVKDSELEPTKRIVQKEVARRIISRLHSSKDFKKAVKTSEKLFKANSARDLDLELIPNIKYQSGTPLSEALIKSGHVKSMREYREFVGQGAIRIEGQRVKELNFIPNFIDKTVVNIGKKRRVVLVK